MEQSQDASCADRLGAVPQADRVAEGLACMQAPALEPQELHFDMKHSPNPTRCAKTQSQEVQSAEAELLARTPVLTAEDDEGTNNSTREASNAASAVSTIHSTSSNGQALWHHAKEKVMAFVDFSMGFHTLRDMTGNHTLDPRKLKLICRLGKGSFGVVDKYSYNNEKENEYPLYLAIKTLNPELCGDSREVREFLEELRLMKKLDHGCIVDYKGFGTFHDKHGRKLIFVAQECMDGGTLRKIVLNQMRSNSTVKLYTREEGLSWAIQITKGLAYLHSCIPKVIHRDLKPENVLLDSTTPGKRHAKLADFGLSSVVDLKKLSKKNGQLSDKYELTGGTGSFTYMAPEVLKNSKYNEKVDVFSVSIIIWEIFSYRLRMHRDPKEGLTTPEYLERVKQNAYDTAYQGKRPPLPPNWPAALRDILQAGWANDPDKRPSCNQMVQVLKSIEDEVQAWETREGRFVPDLDSMLLKDDPKDCCVIC